MNPEIEKLQTLVTSQRPEKADVIVWLQGNMYDRGRKVLELYQAGFASQIVITGNNTRVVEDDSVGVDDLAHWLEERGVDERAIILDKQSLNTYDQATQVIKLACGRGWFAILLVGSTHHQLRAFITFLHQAHLERWEGRIINQPAAIPWDTRPSGRRETTGEAFQEELDKIERYKNEIASVEDGLRYFGTLSH